MQNKVENTNFKKIRVRGWVQYSDDMTKRLHFRIVCLGKKNELINQLLLACEGQWLYEELIERYVIYVKIYENVRISSVSDMRQQRKKH